MTSSPKTLQIFLPHGDPSGIRVAEITTRIVQIIEVPRSLLFPFLKMPESAQVAVYFLRGDSEHGAEASVYIGQTSDLRKRLLNHHKERTFWERALVLISRTHSLTQTHGLFLEWYSIEATRKAGRFFLENGNGGTRPHIPAPLEADCLEIFETAQTLLATLGHPFFSPVATANTAERELYYCQTRGAKGKGLYTQEGFVVLKDSEGPVQTTRSAKNASLKLRHRLINSGILRELDDRIVFTRDHLFSSPSQAAAAVMGSSVNGWTSWKNDKGETLDLIKRQRFEIPEP